MEQKSELAAMTARRKIHDEKPKTKAPDMSDSTLSPTEHSGPYSALEKMTPREIVAAMNQLDRSVADAVGQAGEALAALVEICTQKVASGGRVFYLGAGTSGRLGVVDASEIPPTFGVEDVFIGLIAGGDSAIRQAVEGAEDDAQGGIQDLEAAGAGPGDVVVGIAASGRTPYVLGAVNWARAKGWATGCITCHPQGALAAAAQWPVVVDTGAEFLTGSTRLKAGTAQKLVLNTLSTGVMIGCGHVKGNKMVDMKLANIKLLERAARMVIESTGCTEAQARAALEAHGSVRTAISNLNFS